VYNHQQAKRQKGDSSNLLSLLDKTFSFDRVKRILFIMETLDSIQNRRSIRKFTAKPIPEEVLKTLLRAAMQAPSAMDQQSWCFVVCTDKEALAALPQHHTHCHPVAAASAAVLVCHDSDREKLPGYWPQDLAACTQNLLLATHDLGLGAVWIGVYPNEENVQSLRKRFELPANIIPFSLIALGYPDETPEKKTMKTHRGFYSGFGRKL
jgi:nitroreductase